MFHIFKDIEQFLHVMNKIVFDRVPESFTCVDLLNIGSKSFYLCGPQDQDRWWEQMNELVSADNSKIFRRCPFGMIFLRVSATTLVYYCGIISGEI